MEGEIGESLERIGRGIGRAATSVDQSEEQKRARNLAQMRELVQGLESLERRMQQGSRGRQADTGDPGSGWGAADGQYRRHRNLDPAEIDNFRRDFAERRGLLEQLAGVLTSDEHGAQDISNLLNEMREIEQNEDFDDPQRSMERQRKLIAQLKELELRLKSDQDQTQIEALPLTGDDSVSPEYRRQVEEYFRNLSRADTSSRVAD